MHPKCLEGMGSSKLSTLNWKGDILNLMLLKGEHSIEDVLVDEVGVARRRIGEKECDKVNVVLGGVAAMRVPLQATRDGVEAGFRLVRASEGMRLGCGESCHTLIGRAAKGCGRCMRPLEGCWVAARAGVVATVRVRATVASGLDWLVARLVKLVERIHRLRVTSKVCG